MCLDTITRTETLKKDKRVWKVVACPNKTDELAIYHTFDFSKSRLLHSKPYYFSYIFSNSKKYEIYEPHFHCLVRKASAINWGTSHCVDYPTKPNKALPYIIPAGTEVLYGKQDRLTVIVTPVLINPRMTEPKPKPNKEKTND